MPLLKNEKRFFLFFSNLKKVNGVLFDFKILNKANFDQL